MPINDTASSSTGKVLPYEAPLPLVPFLIKPLVAALLLLLVWLRWPHWENYVGFEPASNSEKLIQNLPSILLITSLTILAIRLAQSYAQLRLGHRPPLLVRQIISLAAITVGVGITVASLFDVPVASLMTTSGLLVAVIGIALKNMISDLFNGISLPVKVGDWVEVAGMRGQVAEISWRATRLVGSDGISMVIPNTHFITHPMQNYSPDQGYYLEHVRITLPTEVTAYQAERILVGAAQQIESIAALPRMPEARIVGFNDNGVEWDLRFPVTDAGAASLQRHRVQRALMRDLYYSGIELPVAHIEIHHQTPPPERPLYEEITFLSQIPLFSKLTDAEAVELCSRMRGRLARAGIPVVEQGQGGDSLFIVQEGLLSAEMLGERGVTELGKIRPGQFFGEMSLLTGAERSATVTPVVDSKLFEIDRESLAPILTGRPEVAAMISRVLAERQLANQPKLDNAQNGKAAEENLAQQILGHILDFFGLAAKPRYSSV